MKRSQFIFVCYNTYPSTKGGAEVFNHYLMEELGKSQLVSCICLEDDRVAGVNLLRLPKLKPKKFFAPIFTILALFYVRFKHSAHRNKIMLSYSRSSVIHWLYFPLLKLLLSAEYFIVIHDSDFSPWFPAFVFRFVFRSATNVFGVSRLVCKEYEARTGRKIIELRPFIPFPKADVGKAELRDKHLLPRDAQVLLFVGSLKPLKKPLVLLDALEGISEEQFEALNLHVLIVGDGPLRKTIKSRVARSHLARFVRLCGQIEREELPDYFALSDIYVMPSQREAFPLSLMEAIINRLCILGADSPGINSLIKDGLNGLLFNPQDASELRQKLLLLARDKGLRDNLTSHPELRLEFEGGFQKMTEHLLNHLNSR